jgi:hypothetical protein
MFYLLALRESEDMRSAFVVLALALTGCSFAQKIKRMPVGTSGDKVMSQMGYPDSRLKTQDGHEVWAYLHGDAECRLTLREGKTIAPGSCRTAQSSSERDYRAAEQMRQASEEKASQPK